MANPEHVEVVKRARKAIVAWRKANPNERIDLGGGNLRDANLEGANLEGAKTEPEKNRSSAPDRSFHA